MRLLGSIPSPSKGILHLGPIPLHAYGLCLAIGVLAAATVAERRWEAKGGRPGVIGEMGVVVVVSGVLGARIYHLFTGYDWKDGGIAGTIKIWQGGLSIWGAVGGGVIAILVVASRKHLPKGLLLDSIAPGVVLAQAIGRWGNYFNQELFGRPTKLPWALEIDLAHRPARYIAFKTFQPTFLYESLWCLAVFAVLVAFERRFRTRSGQTFALYVALYTFGRFFFELMRSDPATRVFGVRFNALVSAVLCVSSALWFAAAFRRPVDAATGDEGHTLGEPDLEAPTS